MIYELSLVAKSELSAEEISVLQSLVHEVAKQHDGDILIQDDWGRMQFAQTSKKGDETGRFLYFLYKANSDNNKELERRMKINEGILKAMIVKLGDDSEQDQIVKAYKTPYSKNYKGSVMDEDEEEEGDDRPQRRFSRRKNCVFTMKKVKADWKDPQTYNWLVNEFGKVSPSRVTGISRKHQRFVTTAIKRARQIGLASYMSNRFAEHV